jgi:hypothetical protein
MLDKQPSLPTISITFSVVICSSLDLEEADNLKVI